MSWSYQHHSKWENSAKTYHMNWEMHRPSDLFTFSANSSEADLVSEKIYSSKIFSFQCNVPMSYFILFFRQTGSTGVCWIHVQISSTHLGGCFIAASSSQQRQRSCKIRQRRGTEQVRFIITLFSRLVVLQEHSAFGASLNSVFFINSEKACGSTSLTDGVKAAGHQSCHIMLPRLSSKA